MLLELRSDFTLYSGYLNPALNYLAKVISPPSLFSGMAKASGSLVRDKNNKDKTEMEKNEEWKGNTLAGETSYLNLRKTTSTEIPLLKGGVLSRGFYFKKKFYCSVT